MTIAIIVNAKGGTAMGMERDELLHTFEGAFGEGANVVLIEGKELPDAMKARVHERRRRPGGCGRR